MPHHRHAAPSVESAVHDAQSVCPEQCEAETAAAESDSKTSRTAGAKMAGGPFMTSRNNGCVAHRSLCSQAKIVGSNCKIHALHSIR